MSLKKPFVRVLFGYLKYTCHSTILWAGEGGQGGSDPQMHSNGSASLLHQSPLSWALLMLNERVVRKKCERRTCASARSARVTALALARSRRGSRLVFQTSFPTIRLYARQPPRSARSSLVSAHASRESCHIADSLITASRHRAALSDSSSSLLFQAMTESGSER